MELLIETINSEIDPIPELQKSYAKYLIREVQIDSPTRGYAFSAKSSKSFKLPEDVKNQLGEISALDVYAAEESLPAVRVYAYDREPSGDDFDPDEYTYSQTNLDHVVNEIHPTLDVDGDTFTVTYDAPISSLIPPIEIDGDKIRVVSRPYFDAVENMLGAYLHPEGGFTSEKERQFTREELVAGIALDQASDKLYQAALTSRAQKFTVQMIQPKLDLSDLNGQEMEM